MGTIPEIELLWLTGDLSYLLDKPKRIVQQEIYTKIHQHKEAHPRDIGPFVLNAHRRLGKTFILLLFLIEQCMRKPNTICKFAAPFKTWADDIVLHVLPDILADCPDVLYEQVGKRTYFNNPWWPVGSRPSILEIHGIGTSRGNRMRGQRTDWAAIDEAGYIPELVYLVRSVLMPQFRDSEHPALILASTPPESVEHEFMSTYVLNAEFKDTYCFYPVDLDPGWTDEDDRLVLSETLTEEQLNDPELVKAAKNTDDWKREYDCIPQSDPERMIVPEWNSIKDLAVLPEEYKRPAHYYHYAGADFGLSDHTAVVYGYHDFYSDTIIIEDELFMNYVTTEELANSIIGKEKELYEDASNKIMRYGDHERQQVYDLEKMFGLKFASAKITLPDKDKYDKGAAINLMRMNLRNGSLKIHPRCKNTIRQLKGGIWNKQRTKFERIPGLGHMDCIDALAYLNRMVHYFRGRCPIPEDQFVPGDQWREPKRKKPGKWAEQLKSNVFEQQAKLKRKRKQQGWQ